MDDGLVVYLPERQRFVDLNSSAAHLLSVLEQSGYDESVLLVELEAMGQSPADARDTAAAFVASLRAEGILPPADD